MIESEGLYECFDRFGTARTLYRKYNYDQSDHIVGHRILA